MSPVSLLRRVLLCSVAATALAPVAAEAASAPVWSISAASYPTNFIPDPSFSTDVSGPEYLLRATNVGGAPSVGEFTVTDNLPVGLKPSPERVPTGRYGSAEGHIAPLVCTVAAQTVTCHGETPDVAPGQVLQIQVPVQVEASAPESVLNEVRIEGGGAAAASATTATAINSTPVPFGFLAPPDGLSTVASEADGVAATHAGSHPHQLAVSLGFPSYSAAVDPAKPAVREPFASGGGIRDVTTVLPAGVVANPEAAPRCTEQQLEEEAGAIGCPAASQVGIVMVPITLGFAGALFRAVYNMQPPPGSAGELAFEVLQGTYVHLLASVRSDGGYEITAVANDALAKAPIAGANVTLWGSPSDASHDRVRGECLSSPDLSKLCPTERTNAAFLTMPSACSGPLTTTAAADSWLEPGVFSHASALSTDLEGNPVGVEGCNQLEFKPSIGAKPTTNLADSPSGLDFDLHQPQNDDYDGLATAALKDTTVTLPAGMALNPSAAGGRAACNSAQIGLATPVGQAAPIHFSEAPQSCPDAAKLGTVEVTTPLLDHKLPGAVYLAKPFDNPFGSLLAIYLAIESPRDGIVAKLAGKVEPNPSSGQLTTSFTESPQLPLEDVELHLFNGPRAALTTPIGCGTHTTTSTLVPWSTPEGANATPTDSFQTTTAPGGGTCPSGEANAPNAPAFTAGTIAPQAGAFTPFLLHLARPDGSQRITAIETVLPKGLTGKLAGVPYCSEAQIAAARARSNPNQGALEISSPSCPLASEVGSVDVGAGSGITPLYVGGHAYLAGPYKGAPLSIAIITPAVAGPFDLGTVVVRAALRVDPETAQIKALSDPLPSILQGIPLDVRSIDLRMARPNFTLNPTSCDPMAVLGSATALSGQSAALTSPFQLGGCSALPFKPKLALALKGGTKRADHPALTAVATAKPGEANIARVSVALPHSEFLDQAHIKTICTRVQFAEGAIPGEKCPKGSIYGKATARTPLLEAPLSGPVFLRSSSHPLPDLVAALHGQVDVVVVGRVDSVNGGIRNSFEAVPDAPVSKFTLQMQGGKKGLIVNSRNLCNSLQRATVKMAGQNGKAHDSKPLIENGCKHKPKKHDKKRGHRKKRRR